MTHLPQTQPVRNCFTQQNTKPPQQFLQQVRFSYMRNRSMWVCRKFPSLSQFAVTHSCFKFIDKHWLFAQSLWIEEEKQTLPPNINPTCMQWKMDSSVTASKVIYLPNLWVKRVFWFWAEQKKIDNILKTDAYMWTELWSVNCCFCGRRREKKNFISKSQKYKNNS